MIMCFAQQTWICTSTFTYEQVLYFFRKGGEQEIEFTIFVSPLLHQGYLFCVRATQDTCLYMAVKVIFSWLISVHCWFIYWKWVPLFQVGSLSLQFLRQQACIYHVLLLVLFFFCFNEIFFAYNSSRREGIRLTWGLRKIGIYTCLHQQG